MKSRRPGFWFQSRMNVTNVNIFSSLSLVDMISLTSQDVCGTDQVGEEKMYLAWANMNWKIVGEVTTVDVDKEEFCRASDDSHLTLFPGKTGEGGGRCLTSCSRLLH